MSLRIISIIVPYGADQHVMGRVGHVHDEDAHPVVKVHDIGAAVTRLKDGGAAPGCARNQARLSPQDDRIARVGDVDGSQYVIPAHHQGVDAAIRPLKHGYLPGITEGGMGTAGALRRAVDYHRFDRVGHVQDQEAIPGSGGVDAAVWRMEHLHAFEPRVGKPVRGDAAHPDGVERVGHVDDVDPIIPEGQQVGVAVGCLKGGDIRQTAHAGLIQDSLRAADDRDAAGSMGGLAPGRHHHRRDGRQGHQASGGRARPWRCSHAYVAAAPDLSAGRAGRRAAGP